MLLCFFVFVLAHKKELLVVENKQFYAVASEDSSVAYIAGFSTGEQQECDSVNAVLLC